LLDEGTRGPGPTDRHLEVNQGIRAPLRFYEKHGFGRIAESVSNRGRCSRPGVIVGARV